MRAITLHQPYATAFLLGYKHYETRSWRPSGYNMAAGSRIAIHAGASMPAYARAFAAEELAIGRGLERYPLGAVVALAHIVRVVRTEEVAPEVGALERRYGDYTPGRWAWELTGIRPLAEPVPCRGAQGLWWLPRDIEARCQI